jgi:very-short-patch-repair endonuclease
VLDPLLHSVGVLSTAQLAASGWSASAVRRAVAEGRLSRLRPGWLALPGAHAATVRAVRADGCLSCADALRLRGVWVPEALGSGHVRRGRHAAHRRAVGCRPYGANPRVTSAVDDVETAFRCVLRCGSDEDVVVVADSLLHRGDATRDELERWMRDAPVRVRALLARVDVAESGLESIVRVRLRSCGIRVRTQVWIGQRRVDLLVGDRLVVECDGAEHHAGWAAHAADRERDRELVAAGYAVVRVTYRQVVDDWDAVLRDVLAIVRRRGHRDRRTQMRG